MSVVAAVTVGAVSAAQASIYQVYTSSIGAMTINANDGYCSLAEAIASAGAGHSMYNCPEVFPGGSQDIQLLEGSGKSFSSFHFAITSFTINSPSQTINIYSQSATNLPFIDSTGISGFIIRAGSTVSFAAIKFAYTGGSAGGRIIENYGTLDLSGATFANGNVTPHPSGIGGALYNKGTVTEISSCTFSNNKAKRGGAIYNDSGTINNMNGTTISGNSATMAGGGIYNVNALGAPTPATNLSGSNTTITRNSAKAGGGIFNRGIVELSSSSLTFNTASGAGSGETCVGGASCDGAGGGACSIALADTTYARIGLTGSSVTDNVASGRGGGFYSAGQLNLVTVTISRNQANHGGAIFSSHSGTNHYCSVSSPQDFTYSFIDNNTVSAGGAYGIIDWDGIATTAKCVMGQNRVEASGNSSPACASQSCNPNCPQYPFSP